MHDFPLKIESSNENNNRFKNEIFLRTSFHMYHIYIQSLFVL